MEQAPPVPKPSPDDPAIEKINELLARADRALKAGEHSSADGMIASALTEIDALPSPDLQKRRQIAVSLARARLAMGKIDEAIEALDDHLAKLDPTDFSIRGETAAILGDVGAILGNAGRFEESIPRFQKSLSLKKEIGAAPADIASTLARVAISQARLNQKEAARESLNAAKSLLESDPENHLESLEKLANITKEYGL